MISEGCKYYEILTFILTGIALQAALVLVLAPLFGNYSFITFNYFQQTSKFHNLNSVFGSTFLTFNTFNIDRGFGNAGLVHFLALVGRCLNLCSTLLGRFERLCSLQHEDDEGEDEEVHVDGEEEAVTQA